MFENKAGSQNSHTLKEAEQWQKLLQGLLIAHKSNALACTYGDRTVLKHGMCIFKDSPMHFKIFECFKKSLESK